MKPIFSLAHLTTLTLTPPEMVSLAHRLSYDFASIRMLPASPGGAAYPLMDDPAMLRDTITRMDDTGTRIFDLELIRIDQHFNIESYLPFLETGTQLGAQAVLVSGDDPDEARMIDAYGRLCEAAWQQGLTADLEFMPWTIINNISSAVRVVSAVNHPACGILIDTLHFARSNSRIEEIKALPREWLHYAQLCDAPSQAPSTAEGLIHAARRDRLLPGEGELDLAGIFRCLPPNLPISLEIPSDHRTSEIGYEQWARDVLTASQAFIQGSCSPEPWPD